MCACTDGWGVCAKASRVGEGVRACTCGAQEVGRVDRGAWTGEVDGCLIVIGLYIPVGS